LVTLSTQVPLAKEALQINLAGQAEDEAKLLADFQAVLASLEGKCSWLTDAEGSRRLGFNVGVISGAVAGVAVVIFLALRRRSKRPASP
jgi:hypothetical protein